MKLLILFLLITNTAIAQEYYDFRPQKERDKNLENTPYERRVKDTEYGKVYKDPNDEYWLKRREEKLADRREERVYKPDIYERRRDLWKDWN